MQQETQCALPPGDNLNPAAVLHTWTRRKQTQVETLRVNITEAGTKNPKKITFHVCKWYGGRKLVSGQHQQSSTSSQRRPRDSWPWADFIFIRLTEPRGRDGEEPQQSLGFSLSVSHVVKWEHGGEMSHKTRLLVEPFKILNNCGTVQRRR